MTTTADLGRGPERRSLPVEIHAATKSCHNALNGLIMARLPLCLPPHASNPARYAQGIATLGQIYFSFEQAWDECLASNADNLRMYNLLRRLRIPSLSRSVRLNEDLSLLVLRMGGKKQLCYAEQEDVKHMTSRIRKTIRDQPYLVMSYAWVMYMALFNGGRWIRDQLAQAGPAFWSTELSPESLTTDCLSFWDFEGNEDGEDIKLDFKTKFNLAAIALSETERQDVVDESVRLFEACTQMVTLLDGKIQLTGPAA